MNGKAGFNGVMAENQSGSGLSRALDSLSDHYDFHVNDRGKARYFHGRSRVFGSLQRLTRRAVEHKSGTIFLIQGAPRAGKTALLHELAERAKKDQWLVIEIDPAALGDPFRMAECLGKKVRSHVRRFLEAGIPGFKAGLSSTAPSMTSVVQLLKQTSIRRRGLLLVLDEAQTTLLEAGNPSATYTLNAIHNGKLGQPVILLAGGLGHTSEAFSKMGISQLKEDYLLSLGQLDTTAERNVIQD